MRLVMLGIFHVANKLTATGINANIQNIVPPHPHFTQLPWLNSPFAVPTNAQPFCPAALAR